MMKFTKILSGIILSAVSFVQIYSCMCTGGRIEVVNPEIFPGETLVVFNSTFKFNSAMVAGWKFWLENEEHKKFPFSLTLFGSDMSHLLLKSSAVLDPGKYRLRFKVDPTNKMKRADNFEFLVTSLDFTSISVVIQKAVSKRRLPELALNDIRIVDSGCGPSWYVNLAATPPPDWRAGRMQVLGPFLIVLENSHGWTPKAYKFIDELSSGEEYGMTKFSGGFTLGAGDGCDFQFHLDLGVSILRIYRKDQDRLIPVRSWQFELPIPGGISLTDFHQAQAYLMLKNTVESEFASKPDRLKFHQMTTANPGIEKHARLVEKYFKKFENAEISFPSRELHVVMLQDQESLKTMTLDDFVVPVKKAAADKR